MQGFKGIARYLASRVLSVGLLSLPGLCLAQEVDAPRPQGGSGSVLAPSEYLNLIVPVDDRIALKLYGFHIGELGAPSAQVDVPIRMTKLLTITPSYLYYSVPSSGLDELANRPGAFTDSYQEHQFRVDAELKSTIRGFELSGRNMYVRRFRPAPAADGDRYRGRIRIAHPIAVKGHIWKPFASYEAFYDHNNGGWDKDRIWTGVTLPLAKRVWVEPSYLWERSDKLKTVNYLLFGLIVRTK